MQRLQYTSENGYLDFRKINEMETYLARIGRKYPKIGKCQEQILIYDMEILLDYLCISEIKIQCCNIVLYCKTSS
jgi:hypothetical protein